jgi:ParB family transcriptional regulator, chromosome partitioning protein
MMVPIDKLEVCLHNPRKTDFDLSELVDSIKTEDVKEIIEVHPYEDKYHVLAGQRRYLAAKQAGKTELECLVYPFDENEAEDWCMKDAFHKKEYNPIDISNLSLKAVEKYGTIANASKATGISESKLKKYNGLRGMTKAVKDRVGSLGTEAPSLETLGKIASLPVERQKEALAAVEGKTRADAGRILDRFSGLQPSNHEEDKKKVILVELTETVFDKLTTQAEIAKISIDVLCAQTLENFSNSQ